MLARWEAEDLVRADDRARRRAEFVFFEGPPTANGRPGIHHVFARTIKDLFCRHRAMKGFHVGRKAGWDTHGLPVEIEVEKQLGISGKQRHRGARRREVQPAVPRERVQVQGRVGAAERSASATGSTTAIRTSRTRTTTWRACGGRSRRSTTRGLLVSRPQDPAVLPALRDGALEPRGRAGLQGRGGSERLPRARARPRPMARPRRARILVWTTTPWTLVSNTALAVHPRPRVRRAARDATGQDAHAHPRRIARARACSARTSRTAGTSSARITRRRARRAALPPPARLGAVSARARTTR